MSVRGDAEMSVILHGRRATPMARVGRSDAALEMRKKDVFMILALVLLEGQGRVAQVLGRSCSS